MKPEELAAKLPGAFAAMREGLMEKVTVSALGRSRPRTPVRTGALRASETSRVEHGGMQGFLSSDVVYAPFVHARVPFFEQGIEDALPEIERLMQEAGEKFVKDVS